MKYKTVKRINGIPKWVKSIVFPIIILLAVPFGIAKIIELIPIAENYAMAKQDIKMYIASFNFDTIIALCLIITYCLRKVTMRNNFFKLMFLMLALHGVHIGLAYFSVGIFSFNNPELYIVSRILSSIIEVVIFIAILLLIRFVMKHTKCFRPKRLKWVRISVMERNDLIIGSVIAIAVKILISIWNYNSFSFDDMSVNSNFLDFIDLLSTGEKFQAAYSNADLIMSYCLVKLVFCPVKKALYTLNQSN